MPILSVTDTDALQRLGIALLLGLLVGLQREHAESRTAGLRTFPLVALLGGLCGWIDLTGQFGGIFIAVGSLGPVALVVMSKLFKLRQQPPDSGSTTDVAVLVMYAVGAAAAVGSVIPAVLVGVTTAILLQFKGELHGIVRRLSDNDVRAVMQFALITGIVLPVLPRANYGPYGVWNPFEIWLMVVLIVGMSLTAYIVYKFFGERVGIVVGGIIGGAISSTATTVSFARRSKSEPRQAAVCAGVVLVASAVVNVRVLIEVAVVARSFLPAVIVPLGGLFLATVIAALATLELRQDTPSPPGSDTTEHSNPTELKSAIVFALLYAIVSLALTVSRDYFGQSGSLLVAGLSGLTDMDAIALSTSRMVASGALAAADGWPLIVAATLSNLIFKAGIVIATGSRAMSRRVCLGFLLPLAVGLGLLAAAPHVTAVSAKLWSLPG